MFVNWAVFLFNEIWKQGISKMKETLMRRPYIIQASKMRPWIEEIVSRFEKIPFYVDNGAFYLFEDGHCSDLEPNCKDCPVNKLCKKYLKWTAYQIWEE